MAVASTPTERLEAAIRLEPTGTVPVSLHVAYFSARFAGITAQEWLFDLKKQRQALLETYERLGGWDTAPVEAYNARTISLRNLMKVRLPGIDLAADVAHQLVEEPLMTVEDYDLVIDKGYPALLDALSARLCPGLDPDELRAVRDEELVESRERRVIWAARGVPVLSGGGTSGAYSRFAATRSMKEFMIDLHRRPEKVKQAIAVATPHVIATVKAQVKASGVRRATVPSSRENGAFISPRQFEEISFPAMKQTVEALVEDGITPIFHFDQDWVLNLPYLRQFPKKKCILQLDGFTDIFKTKEVLGDHMCIMGDVPPTMLALGTPEQVTDYCKTLIDRVGEGGGFILAAGCQVPIDAKPENVQAMLDTARTYPHH